MSEWFPVSHFILNRVLASLSPRALRTYMLALSYAHQCCTGNVVPSHISRGLGVKSVWNELKSVQLCVELECGSFELCDTVELRSASRSDKTSRSALSAKERQRAYRERKRLEKLGISQEQSSECVTERNENVTDCHVTRDVTRDGVLSIYKEIDIELELEKKQNVTERYVTHDSTEVTEAASVEAQSPSQLPPPSSPQVKPDADKSKRGTRLKPEWEPSTATVQALKSDGFEDPLRCLPSFRDYWTSTPGQRGLKLDWDATFRNWVRNDKAMKKPLFESKFEREKRLRQGAGKDPNDLQWYRDLEGVF